MTRKMGMLMSEDETSQSSQSEIRKTVHTVGEECGSVPLEPCLEARDNNEERRPEHTPP